jgi:hypothetical protein
LEVLDKQGVQVIEGEVGEITVTGFNSFLQPFIRYQTGDMGTFLGYSNNKQAAGREQDYFLSIANEKIPITSIISGSHLSINEHVLLWQIQQLTKGELIVILSKTDFIPEYCKDEIILLFKDFAVIYFKIVDTISRSKSGKHKFFISM